MAEQKETTFKKRVRKFLETLPNTWFEKIQQVATRGTPDILACVRGTFVALELKKDSKAKIDALQKHKLTSIAQAGGQAWVVHPGNFTAVARDLMKLAQGERK